MATLESPQKQFAKLKVDIVDTKLRKLSEKPASADYLDILKRSQGHIGLMKKAKCEQLKKEIAYEREQKLLLKEELQRIKSQISRFGGRIPTKTPN